METLRRLGDDPLTSDQAAQPPRQEASPSPTQAFDPSQVITVYVLHLAGFVTGGLTTLIGLILAYAFRKPDQPIAASHFTNAIHVFWKGLLYLVPIYAGFFVFLGWWVVRMAALEAADGQMSDTAALEAVGSMLGVIGLLIILSLVQAVWFVVRCAKGIARAGAREAYPNPAGWGF